MYCGSYQKYNEETNFKQKLFSINIKLRGPKRLDTRQLTAMYNKATTLYHFDGKRFYTEDDMLNYVINM
jgi:hypothetical protein